MNDVKYVQLKEMSGQNQLYPVNISQIFYNNDSLQNYFDNEFKYKILNSMYPVGSVVMLGSTEDANDKFNNSAKQLEWQKFSEGKILVGYGYLDNDTSKQGFLNTSSDIKGQYNVTLQISTIPSHRHQMNQQNSARSTGSAGYDWGAGSSGAEQYYASEIGGSGPHNNVMPYIAYNIWVRTK